MSRISLTVAIATLALFAVVPAHAALPKLTATVGPGFDITLKRNGTKVTRVAPGKYTLVVADKSSIHNFHLVGPGVRIDSGIGRSGTKTYTVALRKGTYRFLCDPHELVMHGSFRVG